MVRRRSPHAHARAHADKQERDLGGSASGETLESEACASGAVCRCPSESVSKYIGAVKSSHYILTFQNLSGLREQKSEAIEKIG